MDIYGDLARVRRIIERGGTWAVVGLRENRSRPAYGVAKFLQDRGIRIIPVHPQPEMVHGEPGYPSVEAAAAAVGQIDVVDIFVRPDLVDPIVDGAIAVGASAVWLQIGVVNEPAARRARAAGLLTVMDQCPAQLWDRALAHGIGTAEQVGESCPWVPPGASA